jgi:hypothetical protein
LALVAKLPYARRMRRFASAVVLAAALALPAAMMLPAGEAAASAAYESPYTVEQTYGTALRLVRVDLGCIITEKDPANGYLLFEYTSPESGNRVHRGSLEIVRGHAGTHVSVQLSTLPRYHEQMILDALTRKLTAEYGSPPPKPAPKPPLDAGADGE